MGQAKKQESLRKLHILALHLQQSIFKRLPFLGRVLRLLVERLAIAIVKSEIYCNGTQTGRWLGLHLGNPIGTTKIRR